jgi:hypothetical protein
MLVVYFLFAIFMINTMSALFTYQEAKKADFTPVGDDI